MFRKKHIGFLTICGNDIESVIRALEKAVKKGVYSEAIDVRIILGKECPEDMARCKEDRGAVVCPPI